MWKVAVTVTDGLQRVSTLASLVGYAPHHVRAAVLKEAAETALRLDHVEIPYPVLERAVRHVPEAERLPLDPAVVRAIQSIGDVSQSIRALLNLALYVRKAAAPVVLDQMLDVCAGCAPETQMRALLEAAPHLPPAQRGRAIRLAAKLPDPSYRTQALARLAIHADPSIRPEILALAINAVRDVKSPVSAIWEIGHLAPHLPEPERGQMLEWALRELARIDKAADRADALTRVAPYLEGNQLADALKLAEQIREPSSRTKALRALALASDPQQDDRWSVFWRPALHSAYTDRSCLLELLPAACRNAAADLEDQQLLTTLTVGALRDIRNWWP